MSQTRRETLLQDRLLKGTNPATRSLVLGGTQNAVVGGALSSVLVGEGNRVTGSRHASVVSGIRNTVTTSDDSVTVGGLENTMFLSPGSVSLGGGLDATGTPVLGNAMTGTRSSTMLGGYDNVIQGGYQAGIFSAWEGVVDGLTGGTVQFSTICGGSHNIMRAANSGILGGHDNVIGVSPFGWNAIVGGGENTMTNSQFSAIVGAGGLNTPTHMFYANRCVIAGGGLQSLTGASVVSPTENSAMLGGFGNTLTHSRSVVVGGSGLSSDATDTVFMSKVNVANLPTSSAGLSAGTLWASGSSPNKYVRIV